MDVYNLRLSAGLVVSSGCDTGLGKEIRGEGLIGLNRGFMYAGSSRVVASLWDVDDVATAQARLQHLATPQPGLFPTLRPATLSARN